MRQWKWMLFIALFGMFVCFVSTLSLGHVSASWQIREHRLDDPDLPLGWIDGFTMFEFTCWRWFVTGLAAGGWAVGAVAVLAKRLLQWALEPAPKEGDSGSG